MFPWEQVIQAILYKTIAVYFEPMFWVVLALVGYQYWRLQKSQKQMFGVRSHSLRHQIVLAAFWGTIGGVVGSILLTFVGVTFNQLGFEYIWPLALILMAFNMRFLCFAYAGGLVALSNVLFHWPVVNVPQVLALVAILHITESFLIAVSTRHSATPLILRLTSGRLVGAFSLQNYWPLPLVLMMAIASDSSTAALSVFSTLDWWPLLPQLSPPPAGHHWLYATLPVVAALGYTDIAVTMPPAKRRRESALHLAMYSVLLLCLALLSVKHPWLQLLAALVSPMGHELLIQMDNRRETSGLPCYVPPRRGIMLLDTVLDTPAYRMNLQSGDILLAMDGREINNGYELAEVLATVGERFTVTLLRKGSTLEKKGAFTKDERRLGVILVPEGRETQFVELAVEKYALWEMLKGWYKK